jgi:hypothetical protein
MGTINTWSARVIDSSQRTFNLIASNGRPVILFQNQVRLAAMGDDTEPIVFTYTINGNVGNVTTTINGQTLLVGSALSPETRQTPPQLNVILSETDLTEAGCPSNFAWVVPGVQNGNPPLQSNDSIESCRTIEIALIIILAIVVIIAIIGLIYVYRDSEKN